MTGVITKAITMMVSMMFLVMMLMMMMMMMVTAQCHQVQLLMTSTIKQSLLSIAKWNQKCITKILFSPDFDSSLCSYSTCNKSPIRLLKGFNKSTLICNKISKLLKRYLSFKLPIRTQLEVFVQEMPCGGGQGCGSNRGGRGMRGRRRENGRVSRRTK